MVSFCSGRTTSLLEVGIPKVGKKHFSYSPGGKAAAKKYAKKTGKKMTRTSPKRKKRSY